VGGEWVGGCMSTRDGAEAAAAQVACSRVLPTTSTILAGQGATLLAAHQVAVVLSLRSYTRHNQSMIAGAGAVLARCAMIGTHRSSINSKPLNTAKKHSPESVLPSPYHQKQYTPQYNAGGTACSPLPSTQETSSQMRHI
jgi:hypothetical protein